MKKNYFLAVLFVLGAVTANAQFVDDMESYTDGQPVFEGWWTDWGCGGGAGCAIISSSAYAQGGSLSVMVPGDTTTDAVLDCGNKIFGTWGLGFWMYIPAGHAGYWNWQGQVPIGAGEWIVGNINLNEDGLDPGNGYIDDTANGVVNFTYPEDQWFWVATNVDISFGIGAATWSMWVDGNEVVAAGTPFTDGGGVYPTALGGIDFFSASSSIEYYIDTMTYQDTPINNTPLGIQDLEAKGFAAYPNPVQNTLNLEANEAISSVSIYNVLGQQVYSANVNALRTSVDMASYTSGAYFVKVNVGGTEGIVKILK